MSRSDWLKDVEADFNSAKDKQDPADAANVALKYIPRLLEAARAYAATISLLTVAMQQLVDAASGLWEDERLDGLLDADDDPYVRRLDDAIEKAQRVLEDAREVR